MSYYASLGEEYKCYLSRALAVPSEDLFLPSAPWFVLPLHRSLVVSGFLPMLTTWLTMAYIILLGMSTAEPPVGDSVEWYSALREPFAAYYTAELGLLLLLYAFSRRAHRQGGLRALAWTLPYLAIVVAGWLECAPSLQGSYASRLTAIRMLRLLEPFGALNFLSLRPFYLTVLMSIYDLGSVSSLYGLATFLFASVATQLWRGVLQGGCAYSDPARSALPVEPPRPWSLRTTHCAFTCDPTQQYCSSALGDACSPLTAPLGLNATPTAVAAQCAGGRNPDFGITHFDNIFSSLLNAFVLPTFEGWTGVMYSTWQTKGYRTAIFPFFVAHVALSGWMLQPLAMSVLTSNTKAAQEWEGVHSEELVNSAHARWCEAVEAAMAAEAARRESGVGSSSSSSESESESESALSGEARGGGVEGSSRPTSGSTSRVPTDSSLASSSSTALGAREGPFVPAAPAADPLPPLHMDSCGVFRQRRRLGSLVCLPALYSALSHIEVSRQRRAEELEAAGLGSGSGGSGGRSRSSSASSAASLPPPLPALPPTAPHLRRSARGGSGGTVAWVGGVPPPLPREPLWLTALHAFNCLTKSISQLRGRRAFEDPDAAPPPISSLATFLSFRGASMRGWGVPACVTAAHHALRAARRATRRFIAHSLLWELGVSALLTGNIALFSLFQADMPAPQRALLLRVDAGFVAAQALEGGVRAWAMGGLAPYLSSPTQALEGFCTLSGVLELALTWAGDEALPGSALGAIFFHCLRCLRLLFIPRIWPPYRALLRRLYMAAPEIFGSLVLLSLFSLGFGLWGRQLFARSYPPGSTVYPNFRTVQTGVLAIFQIADNENWDQLLKQHMAELGPVGVALFFILTYFLSTIVALNLFVTTLIEASIPYEKAAAPRSVALALEAEAAEAAEAAAAARAAAGGTAAPPKPPSLLSHLSHLSALLPAFLFPAALATPHWRAAGPPKHFKAVVSLKTAPNGAASSVTLQLLALAPPLPPSGEAADAAAVAAAAAAASPLRPPTPPTTTAPEFQVLVTSEGSIKVLPGDTHTDREWNNRALVRWANGLGARLYATFLAVDAWMGDRQAAGAGGSGGRRRGSVWGVLVGVGRGGFTGGVSNSSIRALQALGGLPEEEGEEGSSSSSSGTPKKARGAAPDDPAAASAAAAAAAAEAGAAAAAAEAAAAALPPPTLLQRWQALAASTSTALDSWSRSPIWILLCVAAILASCVLLAFEEPRLAACDNPEELAFRGVTQRFPGCDRRPLYSALNALLAAFFLLELLVSAGARGLGTAPGTLLVTVRGRLDWWSVLDIVVVAGALGGLSKGSSPVLIALRAGRCLRVLRLIARFASLRVATSALLSSVSRSLTPVVLAFTLCTMSALMGLHVFQGAARFCSSDSMPFNLLPFVSPDTPQGACSGQVLVGDRCALLPSGGAEAACRAGAGTPAPAVWAPFPENFDTMGSSMVFAFELLTGENWPLLARLYMGAADSYTPGTPWPRSATAMSAAAYFVFTQVLLKHFCVGMLGGFVARTYFEDRLDILGIKDLSPAHRVWVNNVRLALAARAPVALRFNLRQGRRAGGGCAALQRPPGAPCFASLPSQLWSTPLQPWRQ
jgi:hypothetical protein